MLAKLDAALEAFERWTIALFCLVALTLGIMQVVLRYVFNTGVHWNEAVFVNLTIAAMLLGASRAIRQNLHARVELVAEILPSRGIQICNLVAILSAIVLSTVFLIGGVLYVQFVNAMEIADVDSGIPDAITYAIVPITMAMFIVRYLIKLAIWVRDPADYSRMPGPDQSAGGM